MQIVTRREAIKAGITGLAAGSIVSTGFVIEGCNTTQWISVVLADLPSALEVIDAILTLLGQGQISPTAANQIQTDLQLVQTLVQQYQSAPTDTLLQKIDAALTDAQTNLQAILTAIHVYNTNLTVAIAASVGAAIIIVTSIQALIPAPAAASAKRKALAVRGNGSTVIKTSMGEILDSTGFQNVAAKEGF